MYNLKGMQPTLATAAAVTGEGGEVVPLLVGVGGIGSEGIVSWWLAG
jgi:hypothetical protein